MSSVVLGTAGHVDHGKTVLVEALTGVNTDRWEEERRRGITIDLGFAPLPSDEPDLDISVVDVPGHEDFVKNMLAGATGVDLLLLVVAADEGPMPQTREHLWIARLLGIERGIVALTKTDLVESEWLSLVSEAVEEELRRVLNDASWPIVPVSGRTGQGVDHLRREILRAARAVTARATNDLFRLAVDRSFTVRGVGTVITGTVSSGSVSKGSELRILPRDRTARVRGIQVHGRDVEMAGAGQRAALALTGIDREEVGRGDVLVLDSGLKGSTCLDAWFQLLPESSWPLDNWQRVRLHLGTSETMARVVVFEPQRRLMPGESGRIQFRTERPVVARARDRFVVRFYSPVTTIGGGAVLDPWARPRHRLAPAERVSLDAVLEPDLVSRSLGALPRLEGSSEAELAVRLGAPPEALRSLGTVLAREGRLRVVGDRWYDESAVARARAAILDHLSRTHEREPMAPGVDLGSLRTGPGLPSSVIDAGLADLVADGAVRVEGAVVSLADHRPSLSGDDRALAEMAESRIRSAGAAPPSVRELAADLGLDQQELIAVLRFLVHQGRLVAVTPDLYLEASVLADVRGRIGHFLEGGRAASPADLRDVLDVSRKYLIPILEHLDATGLTRRTPAGRVLRES